jgi:hypothetical protein
LARGLGAEVGERLGFDARGRDEYQHDVVVERFDDWIARERVNPTAIKIDVHSGEVAVVIGMRNCLQHRPLDVIVNVHTRDLVITGTMELIQELEAAGLDLVDLTGLRSGSDGRSARGCRKPSSLQQASTDRQRAVIQGAACTLAEGELRQGPFTNRSLPKSGSEVGSQAGDYE